MRPLNFKDQNLVVDCISFNIKGSVDIKSITNYLFQSFRFNSTIATKSDNKWKSVVLNYDQKNEFQVSFRQHEYNPESKSFWVGIKIDFSGKNAAQIYKIIQAQNFDWNIFQPYTLSLSRFDLCYFRIKDSNNTSRSLDKILVDLRNRIQNITNTRHISLNSKSSN